MVPRLHGLARGGSTVKRERMERHELSEDEVPQREDPDVGAIADGDGQLDQEPPNVEAAEPPGTGAETQTDIETVQREYSALNDRLLRLAAEDDNYRRRSERKRAYSRTRAHAE